MAMPTSSQIVSRYLFDSDTPPLDLREDRLIRAEGQSGAPIEVDANEYMTTGGGRFAGVERFNYIRNFLGANEDSYLGSGNNLPPGIYTTAQLLAAYGFDVTNGEHILSVSQYHQGIYDYDYAQRAYVFGSTEFKINDDALFYVNEDGTREIANVCVEPVDDNFDYTSDSLLARIANALTEDQIDPSGIGRAVPIHFTGQVINRENFSSEDWYALDIRNRQIEATELAAMAALIADADHFGALFAAIHADLMLSEVVTYEDSAGRFVVYDGRDIDNNNANIDPLELLNLTEIIPYSGVVVVAGGGNDTLYGTGYSNDELRGGAGNDILDGRLGADTLMGGVGNEIYRADSADTIYDEDGNGVVFLAEFGLLSDGIRRSDDPENTYRRGDVIYTLEGTTLVINGGLRILNFSDGHLGIRLVNMPDPAGTSNPQTDGDDLVGRDGDDDPQTPVSGGDYLLGLDGNDGIDGGYGDDRIDGGAGDDLIFGGVGNDDITGGAGNDIIIDRSQVMNWRRVVEPGNDQTAAWNAIIGQSNVATYGDGWWAQVGTGETPTGNAPDWLFSLNVGALGWYGQDVFVRLNPDAHPSGNDIIDAGGGSDTVYSGAGHDVIDGGTGNDLLIGAEDNDSIDGGDGDDLIFGDVLDISGSLSIAANPSSASAVVDGNDILAGGAGNDRIYGQGGNDVIDGGTGNDLLLGDLADWGLEYGIVTAGQAGNDYIDGGDGNDRIQGNARNDTLLGGAGDDEIEGDDAVTEAGQHGHDIIDAGAGADIVWGGGGNDTIRGGAGDDVLSGDYNVSQLALQNHGNDTIYGDAGNDTLIGDGGNDYLDGGTDNDILDGKEGDDRLVGGSGQDQLVGGIGNDYLDGGEGDDRLWGEDGDDALYGNEGNDQLYGGGGRDTLSGGHGNDHLSAGDGDDNVSGGEGADLMQGESGNDRLDGGSGADSLDGGTGDDVLLGGAGNDSIQGGTGDDLLDGGTGNDQLRGGEGNDAYVFGRGYGQDWVVDEAGQTTVRLANDIDASDLAVSMLQVNGESWLQLSLSETDDSLCFRFDPASESSAGRLPFAGIEFADGTAWGESEVRALLSSVVVIGSNADDVLTGGAQGGVIYGYGGHDSITAGSGIDHIYGGQGNDSIEAGEGGDLAFGGSGDDHISAGSGDDSLVGGSGMDELLGGSGNDVLFGDYVFGSGLSDPTDVGGEEGNDELIGGAGDDVLDGGLGDDVYIFNLGDGRDVITEGWTAYNSQNVYRDPGQNDVIRFGAGINLEDIEFRLEERTGSGANRVIDLVISNVASGDQITVQYAVIFPYASNERTFLTMIDHIEFADGRSLDYYEMLARAGYDGYGITMRGGEQSGYIVGTIFSDELRGSSGSDILDGKGDSWYDVLSGGGGSDTYLFGRDSGRDYIQDQYQYYGTSTPEDGVDVVLFASDVSVSDLIVHESGGIGISGSSAVLSSWVGIEEFRFADGTVWDQSDMHRFLNAPTDGDNQIRGTNGSDVIDGLAGNDAIYGLSGADTLTGGSGHDYLDGGDGNDVLRGGTGDDQVQGGAGDDVIHFGRGDGRDEIYGYQGDGYDILQFGEGITFADLAVGSIWGGGALSIAISGTDDEVILNLDAIEQLRFSDGTEISVGSLVPSSEMGNDASQTIEGSASDDTLDGMRGNDEIYGRDGNDQIFGGLGHDLLFGGTGNDYLVGGEGADGYVYSSGDGNDVINNGDSDGGFDYLQFEGVSFADMAFQRSDDHLLISMLSGGGSVLVENWFVDGANQIDEIYDMDYQSLSAADINAMVSEPVEILSDTSSSSMLTGGAGNRWRGREADLAEESRYGFVNPTKPDHELQRLIEALSGSMDGGLNVAGTDNWSGNLSSNFAWWGDGCNAGRNPSSVESHALVR